MQAADRYCLFVPVRLLRLLVPEAAVVVVSDSHDPCRFATFDGHFPPQYMGNANAMDGPHNLAMNIFCYALVFAVIRAHPPLALKVIIRQSSAYFSRSEKSICQMLRWNRFETFQPFTSLRSCSLVFGISKILNLYSIYISP